MENKIIKNSIYNVLYRLLNVLYPVLSSAYIARVLTPESIGEVVFAQTLVTYFVTIASLGIPSYGAKVIGKNENDSSKRNNNFTELFLINSISTLICLILYSLFIVFYSGMADKILLIIFSSILICNVFNVDWLYQGIGDYKFIAIRNTIIKIISMISLVAFVKTTNDYIWYTIILCFGTVGNYIFNIVNLKKHVKFTKSKLHIKRHLRPIIILLFATCATEVYTMLDSTMIGMWCSKSDLAFYSNSVKIVRTIFTVLTATVAVYLPQLSYYYSLNDKSAFLKLSNKGMKFSLFLAIPATVGIYMLSKQLILCFYGANFINCVSTMKILSILIVVFSIAYMGGHVMLIATNHEYSILKATIFGAIINIIFNVFLIRNIGYNGAAISSIIAEIVVTSVLLFEAKEVVNYSIENKFYISIIVSTIFMIVMVNICINVFNNNLMQLLISTILGSIFYYFSSLLFGNEISISINNRIKSIFKKGLFRS